MLASVLPATEWRAVYCWLHTFFPYQLEWLLDWSDFAAVLKSRQIGASHTFAAAGVLWGMFGETTTLISKSQDDADEVLAKAKKHAAALRDLGSKWATPRSHGTNTEELVLESNGRLVSLPAVGGGRGYTGNVLLDEFAYHANPKKIWDAAAAASLLGFRLRVLSTPNGRGNLFHDICTNPVTNAGWTIHRVTIDEARAQGHVVDEARCWKIALGKVSLYNQLFKCKFDAVEGALWVQDNIDLNRVARLPGNVARGVVAVDPATTSKKDSDETGIVGVATATDAAGAMHFYVFEDASDIYTPLQWGRAAVAVYDEWELDRVVAEENNGGELVESNIRAVKQNIPYDGVWASKGKYTRAEPVSALYERNLVHHVGDPTRYTKLEEEMTSWLPLTGAPSPNRMDALVWGVSYLAFAPVKGGRNGGRGSRRGVGALDLSKYG